MGKSVEIQEASFNETVIKSEIPVLVDFWAPRCAPCRVLEPIVDELCDEFRGKVTFVKVNRDENPGVASRYGVISLPTMIVFKDGKPVSSITGFTKETKKQLKDSIDSVV